tara:strand:- start:865 stop:1140 length:276 start_codon:yes stop_codon:yes gene_type:complete
MKDKKESIRSILQEIPDIIESGGAKLKESGIRHIVPKGELDSVVHCMVEMAISAKLSELKIISETFTPSGTESDLAAQGITPGPVRNINDN